VLAGRHIKNTSKRPFHSCQIKSIIISLSLGQYLFE